MSLLTGSNRTVVGWSQAGDRQRSRAVLLGEVSPHLFDYYATWEKLLSRSKTQTDQHMGRVLIPVGILSQSSALAVCMEEFYCL
jgi:hypothetical protein